MTPPPQHRVVLVDGVPMSALVAAAPDPRAVIVAVHGGGTSARYFDCPGHPRLSLLRAAAAHGFTAIALDRPGYGASAPYQDEMADPTRRVDLAYGAVDRILADTDRAAGLFLVGHSAGCELALRMAGPGFTVLGVELAGTGLRYRATAWAVIKNTTPTSRHGVRDMLWQPESLYPAEVLTGGLSARGPGYEVMATTTWLQRDFAELAAGVTAPVEFSVADQEGVFESGPDALGSITGLFTAASRVTVNDVADSGHNLSVGLSADAYHRRVLSFVDECIADAGRSHQDLAVG